MVLAQPPDSDQDPGLVRELGDEVRVVLDRWSVGQLGLSDLLVAAILLAVGALLAWLASRIARRYARRIDGGPLRASIVSAGLVVATGLVLVAASLALEVLGFSLGPVLVLILLAAVVLLLVRPLLTNLSSGLLLQLRGALEAGDLVVTNGVLGTVHEVNARSVVLDTPDGRRVHVPNTDVAHQKIENYTTLEHRRSSVDVSVDHDADLEALSSTIVDRIGDEPSILDDPAPTVDLAGFRSRYVIVRTRFWHGPRTAEERAARSAATRVIASAFRETGIAPNGPDVVWASDDVGTSSGIGAVDG